MPDQLTPEVIAEGLRLAALASAVPMPNGDSLEFWDFARHAGQHYTAALREVGRLRAELEALKAPPPWLPPDMVARYLQLGDDLLKEWAGKLCRLREERDALARFKAWTHAYLDSKGVPTHPGGPHSAEGCRIGDRMDWVFAQLGSLQTTADQFNAFVGAINAMEPHAELPRDKATVEALLDKAGELTRLRDENARLRALATAYSEDIIFRDRADIPEMCLQRDVSEHLARAEQAHRERLAAVSPPAS